jgi:hypothetical protein
MAVTTTPKDLLEWAYSKSTKNNPGQLATEDTELFQLVIRVIRKMYSVAARVNPTHFATSADVSPPGANLPWQMPDGVESLYYITDAAGAEIITVPYNDRQCEPTRPALYYEGKAFYEAGNANDPDPTADTLTFRFSRVPADPADVNGVIDSMWDEAYNELLVLEIAGELAKKDAGTTGRDQELVYIAGQRDEWLRLFIMHLEHNVANQVKRFALSRINTPTLVPLKDLLVGGSNVSI